ncbi:STEROL-4ALPHA-METHYL OXIDASE 1-1 family protein [Hibiscus syriacus]|uniref:STEROL-4ALPHA-METHYL OXIDASE 1-1 family protein n=1 Tax=Hibiscus syriacus TaxID=106335 RepID=A0A6A3CGV8_HIBSY|nr:STEROL-4ALPHA-METHYL OXIDASE 1-1 family protein [Hibiscus syriacus]
MAPSSSYSSSSKSLPPATTLPHQSPLFTPIQEYEREEQEDGTPSVNTDKRLTPTHLSTPLRDNIVGKPTARKRPESGGTGGGGGNGSVSCINCRPNSKEKISVVPLDNNGVNKHSFSMASPNGIFKSIFHSLTRKSPKSTDVSTAREEEWKIAAAELSHKLIQATRKRDEALLEASRLKYSMAELEKKLNKLEVYCHNLKSGLDECNSNSPYRIGKTHNVHQDGVIGANEKVIQQFLVSVSEARSSIRLLSRSLTMQLRHMGTKVYERISVLLQPHDTKISHSKNPKGLILYLEALLNKAFFEDFESIGFQKSAVNQILNPIDCCEANYASFSNLQGLTWEEVLNKGTRYFSEEFSKFCDRKMNEIVAMLGWNRAWPEPLLQAFFGASKSVWLVHLLANSLHPGLPIFRVDKGVSFDSVYMEDMDGERARKLVPSIVRIMITPGFYVYGNVVKSKVICRYSNNVDKGFK